MKDPILLKNKKELLCIARQNIDNSGFQYKKGKSRSTMFATPDSSTCGSTKKNVTRNLCEKRLEQLREDLKEVDLQISFSLQQRDNCSNVHNFSKAFLNNAVALPPVQIQLSESEYHEDEVPPDIEVAEDIEVNSLKSDEVHVVLEEDSCRSDESLPMNCSLPLDQPTCVPEENANFLREPPVKNS
ncbi:Hypothetical predicted protein [Paramuricea clavata]|uniref:Uncharacterized protein n=1 Tax=Paramuricea clavata TaxID=317549 RepID=A0A6S7JIM4_PARCT|nr:Hypothetical predicted protein [Paramuricea clavata]